MQREVVHGRAFTDAIIGNQHFADHFLIASNAGPNAIDHTFPRSTAYEKAKIQR